MLYTSYFGNLKELRLMNICPISIARITPIWFKGMEWKDPAPSLSLLNDYKKNIIDEKAYREIYIDYLQRHIGWTKVHLFLEGLPYDRDFAFCCYEKSEAFCHRHIFSMWLRENGIVCNEYKKSQKQLELF